MGEAVKCLNYKLDMVSLIFFKSIFIIENFYAHFALLIHIYIYQIFFKQVRRQTKIICSNKQIYIFCQNICAKGQVFLYSVKFLTVATALMVGIIVRVMSDSPKYDYICPEYYCISP